MNEKRGFGNCSELLYFKKGLKMFKALKDFAWCIDFNKVEFCKDEEFGIEKVKHKEIAEEMIAHKYAEEISSGSNSGEGKKTLQEMTKVELAAFAESEFGVVLSGNKSEMIEQIEKLAEENANGGDVE